MNRVEKEKFLEVNKLIFEGNERLLDRDIQSAEEIYEKLIDIYKELPEDLKTKIISYALDLRKRILRLKKAKAYSNNGFFRIYDGRVIKDLNHLVYVLDTSSDIDWQVHVNSVKNELYDWIRYKLKNKELAELINGLTEKDEIKQVVLRYLLMKDFQLD